MTDNGIYSYNETRGRRTRTITAVVLDDAGGVAWQAIESRDIGCGQAWHQLYGEGLADWGWQALGLGLATFPKEWAL